MSADVLLSPCSDVFVSPLAGSLASSLLQLNTSSTSTVASGSVGG
jgi:hypothetical protein